MARYIDAEKVEKWLHRDDWGTPDARWRPEEEFGKMIDSLPTEDVQEVRHRKWLKKGGKIVCSECGTVDFLEPNYCPNCGSKMERGDENECIE